MFSSQSHLRKGGVRIVNQSTAALVVLHLQGLVHTTYQHSGVPLIFTGALVFALNQLDIHTYEEELNSKILSKTGFSDEEIMPSASLHSTECKQHGADSFHGAVTSIINISNRKYLR